MICNVFGEVIDEKGKRCPVCDGGRRVPAMTLRDGLLVAIHDGLDLYQLFDYPIISFPLLGYSVTTRQSVKPSTPPRRGGERPVPDAN